MESEVVQLCQQMVRLPSVDPQGASDLGEPYGEKRMADFVAGWLGDNGVEAEKQPVTEGRENVFTVAEGEHSSRTLLLTAHMDTVDVNDMTVEPFGGQLRDGRIYGRGSCDDKGSLAALMIAFRDRVRRGNLPFNLALLASCGEEYNMVGSSYFVEHSPVAGTIAGGVFAEPTDMKVIVAHKGVVRVRLESYGLSAHSSVPENGRNAIYTMAEVIGVAKKFIDGLANGREHPRLGFEAAAVTIVRGGRQVNVIPDKCQAQIDWRFLPGHSAEQCVAELAEVMRNEFGDEVRVEMINNYRPMQSDENCGLVESLLDAAERTAGIREKAVFGAATDASSFTELGIATPVFGPGQLAKAHTNDEYIEVDELEKGLAAYEAFLNADWGI